MMRPTPAGREADPLQAACFPLLPFGSRVRGNGFDFGGVHHGLRRNTADRHYLHGDGWLSQWQVARQSAAEVMLTFSHVADGTPYRYAAEQHFALSADSLTATLAVRNAGKAALPFGLGLHPYFPCTPRTRLRATAACCWPEEEDFLFGAPGSVPAGRDFSTARTLPREWVHTAFGGWDGRAEIVWPEHQMALDIAADAAFGVWLLFISDPAFQPGYAYEHFCFEPMTHAPDAHNRADLGGLVVLAPGESLRGTVTFHCRDLAPGAQQ